MTVDTEAIRVRCATTHDAELLANLAEALFRETFSRHNDPVQMDRYCSSHYAGRIQREELERPGTQVWLVEDGAQAVGYAQTRIHPSHLELQRFYLRATQHGRGVAQRLMEHVIAQAAQAGAKTIRLSVWKENARAIAFYRKYGYRIVGEQPFMLGTELQWDYVMEKELS